MRLEPYFVNYDIDLPLIFLVLNSVLYVSRSDTATLWIDHFFCLFSVLTVNVCFLGSKYV